MVKVIARAFRWREMLENGTHATIAEIAAVEKINQWVLCRARPWPGSRRLGGATEHRPRRRPALRVTERPQERQCLDRRRRQRSPQSPADCPRGRATRTEHLDDRPRPDHMTGVVDGSLRQAFALVDSNFQQ